jgi:hypothetical protein
MGRISGVPVKKEDKWKYFPAYFVVMLLRESHNLTPEKEKALLRKLKKEIDEELSLPDAFQA